MSERTLTLPPHLIIIVGNYGLGPYLNDDMCVKELVPLFEVWKEEAEVLKDKRMSWKYIYKVQNKRILHKIWKRKKGILLKVTSNLSYFLV